MSTDFKSNPVFQAVTNSSQTDLNNAIINGYKINVTDESSGITCLDYAILTLKYSMVKPILVSESFSNLLLPSEKKAMLNSGLKTLVKCMDKYVNINKDEDLSDDLVVFTDLKNAGADLSIIINEIEGYSIYHYAIKFKSMALFNILIDANIDSNVCDTQGNDPLIHAFLYGYSEFIPTLISKSTNLKIVQNYSKKSLLHLAVERNFFEAATQLLSADSSLLNFKDDNDKTPLHYVVQLYTKEVAHTYIDYFVSLNVADFNIDSQDNLGNTALHYTIAKNNTVETSMCNCMIKKLVNKGASLYIKNRQNIMPIDMSGLSRSLILEIC
jgi:ankyrin repeat protein